MLCLLVEAVIELNNWNSTCHKTIQVIPIFHQQVDFLIDIFTLRVFNEFQEGCQFTFNALELIIFDLKLYKKSIN